MISYEQTFWNQNKLVLGLDEAGRGPLAGPLLVCGVVLNPDNLNVEITDSKKISEKKRNELFHWILENALWTKILVIDEKTIDTLNIYQATKKGMIDIVLESNLSCVLSDAMPFEIENCEIMPIIKGDQKSLSIAAASILAKVTRDEIMRDLDKAFPQYGFARHKGYPTKAHYEAIKEFGITPHHRQSFKLIRD